MMMVLLVALVADMSEVTEIKLVPQRVRVQLRYTNDTVLSTDVMVHLVQRLLVHDHFTHWVLVDAR
jgi:hypothetical protein